MICNNNLCCKMNRFESICRKCCARQQVKRKSIENILTQVVIGYEFEFELSFFVVWIQRQTNSLPDSILYLLQNYWKYYQVGWEKNPQGKSFFLALSLSNAHPASGQNRNASSGKEFLEKKCVWLYEPHHFLNICIQLMFVLTHWIFYNGIFVQIWHFV